MRKTKQRERNVQLLKLLPLLGKVFYLLLYERI
jgi:hypothetical protein